MGLETATYISDLVSTNPAATDQVSTADDHLRLIKSVLQSTFPDASAAIHTDTGTFTATLVGVTGTVTGTLNWRRTGQMIMVWNEGSAITGTATGGSLQFSGLPTACQTSWANGAWAHCSGVVNNNHGTQGAALISNSGTVTMYAFDATYGAVANNFTGTIGIGVGWCVVYPVG